MYFKLDKQLLNIRFLLYNSMQGTKIVTVLEHVEMACCKSANLSLGSARKLRADRRSQLVLLDSVVIPAAVVDLHPVVPHFQELGGKPTALSTVAAVSAQQPVEQVKITLHNITNEGTPHSVYYIDK